MIGYATCTCPTGYTGSYCSVNIDDCASNPCENQGTCIDLVNGYSCSCAGGWGGTNCDKMVSNAARGCGLFGLFPCSPTLTPSQVPTQTPTESPPTSSPSDDPSTSPYANPHRKPTDLK